MATTHSKKMKPVTAAKKTSGPKKTQPKIIAAVDRAAVTTAKKKKATSNTNKHLFDNYLSLVPVPKPQAEIPDHALRRDRRLTPNVSGCYHCVSNVACHCTKVTQILDASYQGCALKRVTEVTGKKYLCAKSILSNYVTWMVELLDLKPTDTFVDLGCGNGSVLFQVAALVPGIKCIGVEMAPHNAEVARQAWELAKPRLQQEVARGEALVDIEIITGVLQDFTTSTRFANLSAGGNMAIWVANKLMPMEVTHFMSERFRRLPSGCRIMCMSPDLYPHLREVAASRDPEAFELFEMTDIRWPVGAVEWCHEEGPMYRHVRTGKHHPLGSLTV